MSVWKTIKREVGSKYWLAAEHTGPIGTLPNGAQRMAPRMTVIDETCRTMLLANLVALGSFSIFPATFLIAAFAKPTDLLDGWVLLVGLMLGICLLALINGLIAAIRLDTLMPVVGSPLVKGIHFDWGKPKEAEPAPEAEEECEPENERVGAFKDMLNGGKRA